MLYGSHSPFKSDRVTVEICLSVKFPGDLQQSCRSPQSNFLTEMRIASGSLHTVAVCLYRHSAGSRREGAKVATNAVHNGSCLQLLEKKESHTSALLGTVLTANTADNQLFGFPNSLMQRIFAPLQCVIRSRLRHCWANVSEALAGTSSPLVNDDTCAEIPWAPSPPTGWRTLSWSSPPRC